MHAMFRYSVALREIRPLELKVVESEANLDVLAKRHVVEQNKLSAKLKVFTRFRMAGHTCVCLCVCTSCTDPLTASRSIGWPTMLLPSRLTQAHVRSSAPSRARLKRCTPRSRKLKTNCAFEGREWPRARRRARAIPPRSRSPHSHVMICP